MRTRDLNQRLSEFSPLLRGTVRFRPQLEAHDEGNCVHDGLNLRSRVDSSGFQPVNGDIGVDRDRNLRRRIFDGAWNYGHEDARRERLMPTIDCRPPETRPA